MKAYWWTARANFGDALAPHLLRYFANLKTDWDTISRSKIVSIGSVLEHVPPLWDGYVIGSGALYPDSRLFLYTNTATVLALRGPLSANHIGGLKGDYALGDPGLLANELVPLPAKKYDIGIIPHWSDGALEHRPEFYSGRWSTVTIRPDEDPLQTLKLIGSCRKIVTSSLHGIIVADAFSIPRRLEYSKTLDREGGLYKFRDYHQSIKHPLTVGKTTSPNFHHVDDCKNELYDAYRELGYLIRTGQKLCLDFLSLLCS